MNLNLLFSFIAFWSILPNGLCEEVPHSQKNPGTSERPNFVILFADDIGWGDFGANWNPNKDVTPNLNKMAEEGLRLTDFHAGSSVCTPSRAALLTGRLGLRTGVIENFVQDSMGGLPVNETTIAEVLKESGYYTGMIGKWHLGMSHDFHPSSRGFDYYYGLPYSNDMGCVDVPAYNRPECKQCPTQILNDESSDFEGGPVECPSYYTALPLYKDYEIVQQPADLTALGDYYAEKADSFIDAASKSGKPFLLYLAFAHPHVPLAFADRFKNSTDVNTVYADTLFEMDDIIGRVINSLKQSGVYENTLTWFTGDNGPWESKCPYSGSVGPYLGSWLPQTYRGGSTMKTSTWEGGHREPTVIVWPNKIQPNTVSDALTSTLDIFPTLISAAGAKLPDMRKFDGIDLNDFLEGKTTEAHTELFHPNSGDTPINGEIDTVRMGPYKVFWKTGGIQPDCDRRLARVVKHDPPLVFDVVNDPAESTPLTSENTHNLDEIIASATTLRSDLLADIASDNTTVADYSQSSDVLPCCDPTQFYCRCNKQKLMFIPEK